jgi:transcriptional regulator with XRE-family HTH domain
VRERAGASLRDVADVVGVHYSFLSRLERGLVGTSLSVLGNLAIFYGYGASPTRLLGAAKRLECRRGGGR